MNKIEFKHLRKLVPLIAMVGAANMLMGITCNLGAHGHEIVIGAWEYGCPCVVANYYGAGDTYYVCADDPQEAVGACNSACFAHGMVLNMPGPEGTGKRCEGAAGSGGGPSYFQGYELSGGRNTSTEAPLNFLGLLTYNGQAQYINVNGYVSFTGGCETGTCDISFNRVFLNAANFSVTDGSTTQVTSVQIFNHGPMVGLQSSNYFVIPGDQVHLVVNASKDGVEKAYVYSPGTGQNLTGYYEPSTWTFHLSGTFSLGTNVQLQFNAVSYPKHVPVANAGSPQAFTIPRTSNSQRVLLDGSGTYDPDEEWNDLLWYEGTTYLGSGTTLWYTFGLGTHTVTAYAFDGDEKWSSDTTTVTITY